MMGWPALTRWPWVARIFTTRPSASGRIATLEVDSSRLTTSMPGLKAASPMRST